MDFLASLAGNRYGARFDGMLQLAVASLLTHEVPAIVSESAQHVAHFHCLGSRRLIHPHRRSAWNVSIRSHPADAIPRVLRVRRLSFAFVSLQETWNEEFL